MIEITKIKSEDLQRICDMLSGAGINAESFENAMAIYDGKNILGAAGYTRSGISAALDYLVVFEVGPMHERLKDGLIKSLLNMADLDGVKLFMIKKDKDEDFYKKLRFEELSNRDFKLGMDLEQEEYMYTKLPEFFEHACHSKGKE